MARRSCGREAGPGDPLLFDPSKGVPTPLPPGTIAGEMLAAMFSSGPSCRLYLRLLEVGRNNREVVDPDDLAAWNAAADEFLSLEQAEQAATPQAIPTREAR